jgi:xanthine dehydrogenase accessory factor
VPKILATRVADLQKSRTPYVHARVVLAEKPTSAKPGDEALIFSDGTIEGFVGGSCAESTVRTEGMSVLGDGHALLLRIAPIPNPESAPYITHVYPVERWKFFWSPLCLHH